MSKKQTKAVTIEEKLKELQLELPKVPAVRRPFAGGVIYGNTVILSGQTPRINGHQAFSGTLGTGDITIEEAKEAAQICILNLLSHLKNILGDLNKVTRIIKMNGYVASTPDFKEHPEIIHAASEIINYLFGEEPGYARIAVGMASLPEGAPVEIEMTAEFK